MVRRSTPNAAKAEAYFPVRVRLAVPPGGFGTQLNAMLEWLDAHAGRRCYWVGSNTRPGAPDAALFYFLDLAIARAFAERFEGNIVLAHGRDDDRPD